MPSRRPAARVCSRATFSSTRAGGRTAQAELADAVRELGLAAWELPAQFDEPWRGGDVLRMALQAAGRATAVAERHPDIALNEIAGQVRSIAIDIVRASEAGETDTQRAVRGSDRGAARCAAVPGAGPVLIAARPRRHDPSAAGGP